MQNEYSKALAVHDKVAMGNRRNGLRSIQTLFPCVYEMVDRCIHLGMQYKYFGVGVCLFVCVHAHL